MPNASDWLVGETSAHTDLQRQQRPTVSILINNYNYARFLRPCIDSCLNQTHSPLEIVVVDDGSADDSVQIIEDYARHHEHIVSVLKANGGQASAFNAGVAHSRGEIVMFLDADDYLHPDAVATVAQAWQSNRTETHGFSWAMLHCRLDLVDAEGQYIDQHPAPEVAFSKGNVVPLLLKTGQYSTTVTSGLSFHRAALANVLPIPEEDFRICADGYLVTVLPFYGLVGAVETSIGGRRKHGENLWATGDASMKQLHRAIQHDLLRYHYLSQVAKATGHSPEQPLGHRDPWHLTQRLAFLRLSGSHHPQPSDRPLRLAWWGIQATWCYDTCSAKRRLILMMWFLLLGLVPQYWAEPIVRWRLFRQSRPASIHRILKSLRASTQ